MLGGRSPKMSQAYGTPLYGRPLTCSVASFFTLLFGGLTKTSSTPKWVPFFCQGRRFPCHPRPKNGHRKDTDLRSASLRPGSAVCRCVRRERRRQSLPGSPDAQALGGFFVPRPEKMTSRTTYIYIHMYIYIHIHMYIYIYTHMYL